MTGILIALLGRDDKAQCSCSGPDEPHLMASPLLSGRQWMGRRAFLSAGGPGGCIDHKTMILVSKGRVVDWKKEQCHLVICLVLVLRL